MVRVHSVAPDSLGADLGLAPGTELISVNGQQLGDFLDWEFLTAEDRFALLVRTPDGEEIEFDIERPEGLPMGVELVPPHIRRCGNRCDFCFVDGLPQGLRKTLYIRDDDYRLSFRHGNFATLTNLKQSDVNRILAYRLSPLYVSVHATDPVVRRRLLRNPRAPAIISQLQMFAAGGIQFHTQIVLQPGVNDGPVLARSLEDLFDLGDAVLSVAVVPVGLTEFSKHEMVRSPTPDECRQAIEVVVEVAEQAQLQRGTRWVYGSDELYLRAEAPLPDAATYGDFEQVENGVGCVRYLRQRIADGAAELPRLDGLTIGVMTGTAMGALMPQILPDLEQLTGGRFELSVLENPLFGPSVTTAGLLPGSAFRQAIAAGGDLHLALLPAEAVNDQDRFVDDMPLTAVSGGISTEVLLSYHFTDALAVDRGE
jgi:putative radical SAM enzyme (TIGR03279 family)